jgi:hypothetical protein
MPYKTTKWIQPNARQSYPDIFRLNRDHVLWPTEIDATSVQKSVELGADGQTALHRLVASGNICTFAMMVEHAKTLAIEERHVQKHLLSMMMSLMTEFHELVQHGNSY